MLFTQEKGEKEKERKKLLITYVDIVPFGNIQPVMNIMLGKYAL